MIDAHTLGSALNGTFRLVKMDRHGLDCFEAGPDGFWKSFQAAYLTAPIFALILALDIMTGVEGEVWRIVSVEAIAYVIAWVAFPLLMFYVIRSMGRGQDYFRYLTAYNWFSIPQAIIMLPVSLIGALSLLPMGMIMVLGTLALGLMLTYSWFIAVHGLRIDGFTAAGIVAIDFLLSLLINGVAQSLI